MRIAFYTNSISEHQLPFARELVNRIGIEQYRYIYTGMSLQGGAQEVSEDKAGCLVLNAQCAEAKDWLENAEVLISGIRDIDLFIRRVQKGLENFYSSERWFKPIYFLPGWLRLLVPRYRLMIKRFVSLANKGGIHLLPLGVHAMNDFIMMGINPSCITLWGYFVSPSTKRRTKVRLDSSGVLKVLWVGRQLGWKRCADIRKACQKIKGVKLDMFSNISNSQVREEMRVHDLYVLSSDAREGWGAALNEALEEGMNAVGTYEAGASATMLPPSNLYHAGNVRALARLINMAKYGQLPTAQIGIWTAQNAVPRFLAMIRCNSDSLSSIV